MSDDDASAGASDIESAGLTTPIGGDDDESSDDEPLSVLKQDVKKRVRSQIRDDEEELALAESDSEDESRREDFVHDYSREGDLEMAPIPRVTFPFPSYIRQVASKLDHLRHPLAAAPLPFLTSQNLQLVLSRHASVPSANITTLALADSTLKQVSSKEFPTKDTVSTKRLKLTATSPASSTHSRGDISSSDDEASKVSLEATT
ncbi:hypothetical protein H310_03360 [Aphanomyces invadans]|uniref:Uncharacterized protein n=1 Tax=Aphanomyces invadans TaxID=157072 RepID=A0A024UHF5_9STRA|nr:hypothetical protein H310_03360 [Aphanomyces invadans]ETW05630.1 hypothetical protein H310_03360 [Aphanomyces invadans]|eukprot:XP_008865407.1 hypothetical protein H310_03360 [Aphanomyces invadans]